MQYEADRGYLIVAGTSDSVDYITCAETLAKSLKYWHPNVKVCLVTDHINYQNPLFDYIRSFPHGNTGGWTTDWQVFYASPFHETVKLEADMVISGPLIIGGHCIETSQFGLAQAHETFTEPHQQLVVTEKYLIITICLMYIMQLLIGE
jgi:hypothetical protein